MTTTTPPPPGIVQIEPVADTFVAKGAPDANFGDKTYADVYGGGNTSCVLANGRSYTLMRFDLSAIPTGVTITDARLETTTRAGWAQDGDPAHWAIFIPERQLAGEPGDLEQSTGRRPDDRRWDRLQQWQRQRPRHPAVAPVLRRCGRLAQRL